MTDMGPARAKVGLWVSSSSRGQSPEVFRFHAHGQAVAASSWRRLVTQNIELAAFFMVWRNLIH